LAGVPDAGHESVHDEETIVAVPARVVVFNDDVHTFDEVIHQLKKATGINDSEAEGKAWEIHTRGKAVVYQGDIDQCLRVNGILEEIALNTQVQL
jgi:ATP-dependent Clp protease adapter protein ClpS